MNAQRITVIGGGAAGFMAAITAAEAGAAATILEKGREFLSKVRISGGGRCNVTHACFDAREFARRFPRGERELIGPFQRFGARETVEWFAARGVKLKTEADGRMFPVTDSSQAIIDCLVGAAQYAGVKLVTGRNVDHFSEDCDRLLLATGGCRTEAVGKLAASFGHTIEPPVPSLFTFHIARPWLRELAGIAVHPVEVSAAGLRERGALLVTHTGLSGPAILRLSAWGALELHALDYRFPLIVNWLPDVNVSAELEKKRREHGAKLVASTPLLPARLWERLVDAPELRWSKLSRAEQHRLEQRLTRMEFPVTGKSLNKEEFVTCGGVRLREVNFKTMESRVRPGLYLAGELLDIDGITGGFNFQAAWTTGWIAGRAMAGQPL
jgi:predicted Rossmann fold flavoprotein